MERRISVRSLTRMGVSSTCISQIPLRWAFGNRAQSAAPPMMARTIFGAKIEFKLCMFRAENDKNHECN